VPVALSGDGIHALARGVELASLPDGVALLEEPKSISIGDMNVQAVGRRAWKVKC
jgi:hypothetical protein